MSKRLVHILPLFLLLATATAGAQHSIDSTFTRQRAVDYYHMQAAALIEEERFDESFEFLEHCLALEPSSTAVQFLQTKYYAFLGKDSLVREMLEYIVEREPDNEAYRDALVSHYINTNDMQAAISLYERSIDAAHSKSDIYRVLYNLYSKEGYHEKALEALDALAKLEGSSMDITLYKLQEYLYLGRNEEGVALVKQLIAENPDDIRCLNLLGETYNIIGEQELAEETFKQIIAEAPDNHMATLALADIYLVKDDIDSYHNIVPSLVKNEKIEESIRMEHLAVHIVQKHLQDSTYARPFMQEILQLPFSRKSHHGLYIEFLEYIGAGVDEIVPVLERLAEIDPEDATTIIRLLQYSIELEDIPAVLKYSDEAILYMPHRIEFYYYKAISLNMLDRKMEAIEAFRQGLEKCEEETSADAIATVYTGMGNIYHEIGKKEECYQAYDSALVYNPSDKETLNNYSYFLALDGKELQKALEMSQKTILEEPENQTYLDTYAWILFKMERYEEARAYAEKIISLDEETSSVVLHHIGDIFAKCGDIDKAVIYWERAKEAGDETEILDKKIRKRRYYRGATH